MDADQFRKAAHAAIEEIISYNASLSSRPVLPKIQPGYLAPQLPNTAPTKPQSWSEIQPDIETKIIPGLTHWQSPKFLAFFPAGVTYPSLLGEMYSAAFTAPAFNWLCSPACTELETVVLDWLAKALNLPSTFLSNSSTGGGGVIQGSASEAVVTVMVAARERFLHAKCDAEGLPQLPSREREERIAELRPRLVALASDQAHSATQKGAMILGSRYRSVPTSWTDDLSMTGAAFQKVLEECRAEGLEPYYLTTTLGTTNTCANDDFKAISEVKRTHAPDIWLHIDAAYAGAAMICPEYNEKYAPLIGPEIDSFDMNMHKWLLVNFDASCLYVRNRNDLTRALSINPAYLQNKHTDSGLVTDYRDWQIPLGRRFRALKIWFVMRSYGIEGMQRHIRNTTAIGETFKSLVDGRNDLFEIVGKPQFALTCFRLSPSLFEERQTNGTHDQEMNGSAHHQHQFATKSNPKASTAADPAFVPPASAVESADSTSNTLTKQIAEIINDRGDIFITASTAVGKSFIRVVSGNPNAEEKYVREAFETMVQTAEEVMEKWRSEKSST